MDFKISHYFHKVNYVADRLANLELECSVYIWWDNLLNEIFRFLSNDVNGVHNYRFS